ncbi:MAG: TAXI family TRAP transporter solute-binding subunit [Planctomycetes bacterium]|nr:TAXI family TRAP transporter solute-binding subunit [Planctomycetota bacterium]
MDRRATRWIAAAACAALVACGAEERKPEPAPRPAAPARVDDAAHEHEDPIDARHVLVAGPAGCQSHRLAHALQDAAQRAGAPLSIAPSASDLDGLYLVAWGVADAALVPGNVLCASIHGVARAGVEVVSGLALAEEVHVVVAEASPVRELADLRGRAVSAGRLGSGSALAARDVLLAAGLDPDAGDVTLRHEPPTDGVAGLGAGRVDAVVVLGHCAEVHGARTRLLTIAPDDQRALLERRPGYALAPGPDDGAEVLVVHPWLVARPGQGAALRALVGGEVEALAGDAPPAPEGPPVAFRPEGAALRVAAGPPDGTYARAARGLERVARQADVGDAALVATGGALESLVLLATGQVDLALVQEDLVADALRTPAVAPLLARVRLLAPLFAEEVHLATLQGGPEGPAALRGKVVAMGAVGSGTLLTARRLLRLAGLARGDVSGRAIGGARALEALRAGRAQAAFFVGGQPLPLLAGGGVRLAPIPAAEGYADAMITGEAYGWVGAPVPTVATRALLLCRRDLEPAAAGALVRALFAHRRNLAAEHPKWAELDPAAPAGPEGLKPHTGAATALGSVAPDSAPPW